MADRPLTELLTYLDITLIINRFAIDIYLMWLGVLAKTDFLDPPPCPTSSVWQNPPILDVRTVSSVKVPPVRGRPLWTTPTLPFRPDIFHGWPFSLICQVTKHNISNQI